MPSSDDRGQFGKTRLTEDTAQRIRDQAKDYQISRLSRQLVEAQQKAVLQVEVLAERCDAHQEEIRVLLEFIHSTGVEPPEKVREIIADFEEKRLARLASTAASAGTPSDSDER